jgi:hypothetical protein
VVQLLSKKLSVESTDTLDGKKAQAYHVVNDEKEHVVVYGPFTEKKKIQITLYWENDSGNGLQPIDDDEIKEVYNFF